MRIVAGRFRGRALAAPEDMSIRPTSDRVRESVFNILMHGIENFTLDKVRVIDLFAGTGALGIEALSRGAAFCLFVEEAAEARALVRRNVEALGLTGETRIFRRDATDLGPAGNMEPYGLAFLDPPYGKGLGEKALACLAEGNWLKSGAVCVLEEKAGAPIALPPRLEQIDARSWGETEVRFLQFG
ncbi:methyltransferase [Hyphomicrobium denitrificans 1NES1]|uniref:Methyltransferase n=1 Tax=Hyphomicrobium denitrificans 1NES1 TaxID=670307 RepID=N0BFW3_9HYPH|nr:16S rRNA (guanine(966)-N(2))-methyltransferase RsmD [Hyphomicrobium denitrificans]AGK58985.1 methyltransferase [Hyphomicrobium denitrificans 1NES1]